MESRQTNGAVQLLTAAVDALLATELSALPAVEVTGLLAGIETQRRRLEAVDQQLLAEISERGIAGEYARSSPTDLLVNLLHISPREARARIERSVEVGPRRAVTGQPLPPHHPTLAAAVTAGELSAAHTDVITDCLERVGAIKPEAAPVAEELLVQAGRHEDPRQLAHTGRLLLARLDPDGPEPVDDLVLQRRRGFTLAKLADGSSIPKGHWNPQLTALWETIFDSLAAPNPSAELPDQRSAAQRRHDALTEAALRLLRSDTLPAAGGAPVTILARTSMTELATGVGIAVTGHGSVLPLSRLLELAGDAHVIPVICTDTGGVLAYGRTRRLATRSQRLALAARDGGCSFPGCDRPAAWTEVHHITAWQHHGTTDLDNMCLLCRYHHHNFTQHGWDIVMTNGIPHWLPPPWLDPDRKPLRNTTHHLDDIHFPNTDIDAA